VQVQGAGRGASRPYVVAAAISLAGFFALALIAGAQQFFDLDHSARALVQLAKAPHLDPAMIGVSALGENYGLIPLILLGMAFLWGRSRRWAIALPLLMIGTGLLQLGAKWAVDRPRPNLAAWGFPSGHVLALVVFFGLLAYLLFTSGQSRRRRWGGSLGCAVTVVSVAFSRLYLEAHWVSDVAGGFMLGFAYLVPSIWLVETVADRRAGGRVAQKRMLTLPTTNGPSSTEMRLSLRSE
jgi:membrane-associated phospholipid phosphatase